MNLTIEDKIYQNLHKNKLEELRYSKDLVHIMMIYHNTKMMINIFNIYNEIEYSIKVPYWEKEAYLNK